jgi:hypothetical protein
MGTYLTRIWREDREIEEAIYERPHDRAAHIFELTHGRMPTADEFLDIIENMSSELEELRLGYQDDHFAIEKLCESLGKPHEWVRNSPDIDRLREQSRSRAIKLRSKLGLTEDPMQVDGFAKIRGLLGKYANESENPVEFLRKAREEE